MSATASAPFTHTTAAPMPSCGFDVPHVPTALSELMARFRNDVVNDFMFSDDVQHVPHLQSSALAQRAVQGEAVTTNIPHVGGPALLDNPLLSKMGRVMTIRSFFSPTMSVGSTTLGFGGAYYDYQYAPGEKQILPPHSFHNVRFFIDTATNEMLMRYDGDVVLFVRVAFGRESRFVEVQDVVVFHPDVLKAFSTNPYLLSLPSSVLMPHLIIYSHMNIDNILEKTTEYPHIDDRQLNPKHPFDDSRFVVSMSKCLGSYTGHCVNMVFQDSFPVHMQMEKVHNSLQSVNDSHLLFQLRDESLRLHARSIVEAPQQDTCYINMPTNQGRKVSDPSLSQIAVDNINLFINGENENNEHTAEVIIPSAHHAHCSQQQTVQLQSLDVQLDVIAPLSDIALEGGSDIAMLTPSRTPTVTRATSMMRTGNKTRGAQNSADELFHSLIVPLINEHGGDSNDLGCLSREDGSADTSTEVDVQASAGSGMEGVGVRGEMSATTPPPPAQVSARSAENTSDCTTGGSYDETFGSLNSNVGSTGSGSGSGQMESGQEIQSNNNSTNRSGGSVTGMTTVPATEMSEEALLRKRREVLTARRERNRAAARRSNARVKQARETLLKELSEAQHKVECLRRREVSLRAENLTIRKRLAGNVDG